MLRPTWTAAPAIVVAPRVVEAEFEHGVLALSGVGEGAGGKTKLLPERPIQPLLVYREEYAAAVARFVPPKEEPSSGRPVRVT